MIAIQNRLERHELIQSCWASSQVLNKPSKVREGLVDVPGYLHIFTFNVLWTYFICLKRPLSPGRAIDMGKRSPSTQCHLFTPIRFWLRGIPARIYLKQFSQCGGNDSIVLTLLINHPRRTCQVDHV